jgi:hypothetical protein
MTWTLAPCALISPPASCSPNYRPAPLLSSRGVGGVSGQILRNRNPGGVHVLRCPLSGTAALPGGLRHMFRASSLVRATALLCAAVLTVASIAAITPAGATSPDRTLPRAAATMTITRTSTGPVETGDRVKFTGTAPTSWNGKRVALQRRVGAKADWVKVASPKVTDGTMKANGVATGVGQNSWRFVAVINGKATYSPTVNNKVLGWFYLHDLSYVDRDGGFADQWAIGGKNYGKSVGGDGSSDTDWIEYNLSYRCTTFEAYIGIGDDSESGTSADFYLTLDGERTLVGSKGLGSASLITVNTATRLRIRLEMDPTNPSEPDGSWVFGNARVLCSKAP